ncbi:MAG TPA: type VI secretion system baseplate subunit TssK [Rhodocyclaceae bacterium]|nr:type VI secretion system baseplate subunit TssK [Rhodocyclaceae bacterium]
MIDNNYLPDAVQWSEGMLLSPQHFQQHDIHTQAVLHQRLLTLAPHCWGVRQLAIDKTRLADGAINVVEFEGVMPDGLPIVFKAGDGRAPLGLNVAAQCSPDGRPLKLWLAVPPRTGAMQVPSTSIKRYESLPGVETIDEVTGIGELIVERQRARIDLFAGDQPPSGYPALCLMEVMRNAQGEIVLTSFHPPMVRVGASAFLGENGMMQMFASLRDNMWEKLRELAGTAQEDAPEAVVTLSAEARMHLTMAREIAACLPLLDIVLADPLTSPVNAYQTLAQIVGRMAAIGSNPRPLAMEPYKHSNCIEQFQAAVEFVTRKVNLINTDWDNLAFARVDDGLFARRLPEDASQVIYIELRRREGQTAHDLKTWMHDTCIASEELMPVLRQRRQSGVQWRMLSSREASEMGLRADAMVFELRSQRMELPQHGVVDCFRAGRSILVKGGSQHAPAAIVLHHRKHGRTAGNSADNTPTQGAETIHA